MVMCILNTEYALLVECVADLVHIEEFTRLPHLALPEA